MGTLVRGRPGRTNGTTRNAMSCACEVEAHKDGGIGQVEAFSVKTCCGRFDDPVPEVPHCCTLIVRASHHGISVEVYARQLAERLGKPILLSIALKDSSPAVFRAIVDYMCTL